MAPDFRVDLRDPESWIRGEGEVLRSLPGRRVFRAQAGGLPVVVKEFTPRRLRDRFRSRAEREVARALDAAARGVPVPTPLAVARLPDRRERIFFREIEGARTVQELYGEGLLRGRERHEMARRLGRLIAALHNAGIRHGDLHAGNVLIGGDGRLHLTDAAAMRTGHYLTEEERARSLAQFGTFLLVRANRVERMIFWREYASASALREESRESLRRRVEARLPQVFRNLARKRVESALRRGAPFRHHGFLGRAIAPLDSAFLEEVTALGARRRAGPEAIQATRSCWTYRLGDGGNGEYAVKVFHPKKTFSPFLDHLRGTRAVRAARAALALERRGCRTAPVLAVAADGKLRQRTILVMQWIRDGVPLHRVLAARSHAECRELARRAARMIRRLHDWGLRHRDLKWNNILVSPEGDLILLDMDGVHESPFGSVGWRYRARDLARLEASVSEYRIASRGLRRHFLDAYLGDRPPRRLHKFRKRIRDMSERLRKPPETVHRGSLARGDHNA